MGNFDAAREGLAMTREGITETRDAIVLVRPEETTAEDIREMQYVFTSICNSAFELCDAYSKMLDHCELTDKKLRKAEHKIAKLTKQKTRSRFQGR